MTRQTRRYESLGYTGPSVARFLEMTTALVKRMVRPDEMTELDGTSNLHLSLCLTHNRDMRSVDRFAKYQIGRIGEIMRGRPYANLVQEKNEVSNYGK